jgi:hypothetical protein
MNKRLLIPITIFLIFLAVALTQFNMSRWKDRNVIIWDVIEYYSYLPALMQGDFTLEDSTLKKDFDYHGWALDGPRGKKVIKRSCGVSVLYSPFFFIVYLSDILAGREINTFAPRYHQAISLCAIFYLILGLVILSKLLLHHFSEWTVALTLAFVALGTNLFHYSTAEPGMSHVFSFFLFACFIWVVHRWYEDPLWGRSIIVGLVFGLIVLVRPTNALIGVIFLFYRPSSSGSGIMADNWAKILVMGLVALMSCSPQIFYWKYVTGHWIYFSYGDERFFFGHPHILEGLFSFRKGWFIYTPLMLFAISGLFLKRMPKEYRMGLYIFLPLNIYLVLSWWCWWYGGSFGLRAFIESYTLLSIPLAALVETVLKGKALLKWTLIPTLSILLLLNLFQSYQYQKTLIHWDSMTWKAYKSVFLRLKFSEGYATLLEEPNCGIGSDQGN